MAELLITNMHGRTQTHQLGDAAVVLGRDPGCDIPLDDLGASRRHASIGFENGCYVIKDLGSKNGTLVNEIVAPRATLRSGDRILIGSAQVIFRDESELAAGNSVIIEDDQLRQQPTTYCGEVRESDLSQRRLEILYELTDRLTRLRDRNELLEDAMNVCFEMLRFERGAIAVRAGQSNQVDWPVVRNLRGSEGELKVSRTILGSALTHSERVIVNDTADGPIDPTISIVQNNILSAMCVPLLSGDRNLGVIYGDRISSGTKYTKEDIDFLAGIARLVTTGLINAQLLDEQKLKVALEKEMAMARRIQNGLFPPKLPERTDLKAAALNLPGYHVSGDYYDILELPDNRVAFLMADVTGEGVAASLLMANLQAAVRMSLRGPRSLGELMGEYNRLIDDNTDASRFITCLIGIIDPATRTLELGVAGHHPPQIVRLGKPAETLKVEPGYPLGVISEADYTVERYELGDAPCTIVTYTDGVIEAANESEEFYETEGVIRLFANVDNLDPEHIVNSLRRDVKRHSGSAPQGDDITILAVHLA